MVPLYVFKNRSIQPRNLIQRGAYSTDRLSDRHDFFLGAKWPNANHIAHGFHASRSSPWFQDALSHINQTLSNGNGGGARRKFQCGGLGLEPYQCIMCGRSENIHFGPVT